nr:PREDICTED: uncharacterized protein LOC100877600 isoform X2 [Megachile rotundata]
MPSFFRRLFGFSFRTERLIMNIIGLINSTLDWSPLKWTNELEQIQNVSLTYGTLILGTIGEDTIKTVLSWIVITRIVIAHVYTFSYLANMYPILTSSRPNLLLPWLILSFFKNVVLEVIVLAVCLLYWYDKRFSLAIFLEFVLVKIVPLIVATYNWYSTSCFFLELHAEKTNKFRRSLRSETNFLTGRIFAKIPDTKYRSRSLITLISYESYETVDTQDTISRIFDDPDLTPALKTMKILGITQQDVAEARIRIRERAINKKLTAIDDDSVGKEKFLPKNFFMRRDDESDEQIVSFLEGKNRLATMIEQVSSRSEVETKEGTIERLPRAEFQYSERTEPSDIEQVSTERREETDETERSVTDCTKLCATTFYGERSFENKCNCPKEAQSSLDCDCTIDEKSVEETTGHCCLPASEIVPENSTSKSDRRVNEFRTFAYNCNFLNEKTNDRSNSSARIEEKILEETKGRACSRRLLAEEKLKEEVEQVTNKMGNLEISERKTLEDNEKESKKTVKDDSRAKTLLVDEDLKQRVLLVTNKIDNILRNFKYDPSSRRSMTEQLVENRIEQNRDVPIEAEKFSKILNDTIRKPVPLTTFRMAATIDSEEDTSPTRKGHRYEPEVVGNRLTINLPEYSFGDTGIRRFFEDSMKVFDGCREQDFDELQCIYRQLEKNKWNPFAGPLKRGDEISRSTAFHSSMDVREKTEMERSKTTAASPTKNISHRENLISRKNQVNERFIDNVSGKFTPRNEPSSIIPTKNCYVQTDLTRPSSHKSSERVVTDTKNRKNAPLKRKRVQDPASVSSIRDQRDDKAETRYFPNPHRAQKRNKQHYDSKRQPNVPESSESDRSVCECKMAQLAGEYSEPRLDSSSNKKDDRRRGKLNSFGTVTLSRVTRDLEGVAHRKKPPICPKKPKIKSIVKKLEESKKSNANDRTECFENAREMRALKAYNEVTLCRDKEHFDTQRKILSNKTTVELLPEQSKHRGRSKKSNPVKKIGQETKLIADEYVNKENLSADKSVKLEPAATASMSNDDQSVNEGTRLFGSSNENYACSNLSKVNRVTDKLFDRLFNVQKQTREKSRLATDLDTRKRFSKYSNPKQMLDEQVVSASSSKRLEGVQTGRELERTPAKEDIRDRFANADPTSSAVTESNEGGSNVEKQQDRSLVTIKARINTDISSSWSSNTVDQTCETQSSLAGYPRTEDRSPFAEDTKKDSEESGDRDETPGTKRNESEEDFERDSGNVESLEDENEESRDRNTDYRDSSRNIDVSYLVHGVVLSNANADTSKQPRLRDIVDDTTSRLLHNAFSYGSMDSIFDFTEDSLTLVTNDIANDSHSNALDDSFVCRSSNDAVDALFTDDVPIVSQAPDNLEQTIAVREPRQLNQPEEISVREGEHLIITRENVRHAGIDEFRLDDVLSSIGQLLRTLNVDSFSLEDVDEPSIEILRGPSRQADAEEVDRFTVDDETEEEEENEESSEEGDRTFRFVEENIFTNIKFPVVINWSESLADANHAPESSNSMFDRQVERFKQIRLLPLHGLDEEKKKMKEDALLRNEKPKNTEQSVFFGRLEFSEQPERSDSKLVGSCTSVSSDQLLTDAYRVTKVTSASRSDVESEQDEGITEQTGKNSTIEYEEERKETIEAREIDQAGQDQSRIPELNEQVSWVSVAVIVLMVCWFYIRHFWQTIVSPTQSSSLKPFDIHAVPAPTIALLERIANDEKEDDLRAGRENFEETEYQHSECIEEEAKRLSDNVRIPSFSNSDQEKTRSDLSSIAYTIFEGVERSEEIVSKAENGEVEDLRAAEQEIRTFRFEEADDDSSSANSFSERDEETTLLIDSVLAEKKVDEDDLVEKIEGIAGSGDKKEQDALSDDGHPFKAENAEDRGLSKDETMFGEGKLEEADGCGSTEKKTTVESNLQNIDSFDSTYSEISDTSQPTVSIFDGSSMEEFHTAFNQDN